MKTNVWHSGGVWLLSIWFMGASKSFRLSMQVAWILAESLLRTFQRTMSHELNPSNLLFLWCLKLYCQVYYRQAMRQHRCCNCHVEASTAFLGATNTEKKLFRMDVGSCRILHDFCSWSYLLRTALRMHLFLSKKCFGLLKWKSFFN